MMNLSDDSTVVCILKKIAEMQDLSKSGHDDALDKVIKKYAPVSDELSYDELEKVSAAVRHPELPEYLKKKK